MSWIIKAIFVLTLFSASKCDNNWNYFKYFNTIESSLEAYSQAGYPELSLCQKHLQLALGRNSTWALKSILSF